MSRRCVRVRESCRNLSRRGRTELTVRFRSLILTCALLTLCNNAGALTFYVSPAGNDTMQGTREKPLASLDEALSRLRGTHEEREIVLLSGTHLVRKVVQLSARDSGLPGRPLRIRGEGGNVVLSGYLSLPAAGWRKVTDSEDLQRIKSSRVGDRLRQFRFHDVDRPKLGALSHRGVAADGGGKKPPAMLYLADKRMSLARWPNVGFIRGFDLGEPAVVVGSGEHRRSSAGESIVRIKSRRPGGWKNSVDIWLSGALGNDKEWGSTRVEKISDDGHEIEVNSAGLRGEGSEREHLPEFFFENVFEELDEPNEYFIDASRGLLYFLPPPNNPDWASTARLLWSEEPILRINGGRYIELSGFRVEGTRADGIVVNDGLDVAIKGLTVRQCGGDGVVLSGRDIRVKGVIAEDIGGRGMVLSGGDPVSLKSSGNMVIGSKFVGTGWWNPSWHSAIELVGVGHQVRDCVFSDLPDMAVQFRGNDFLIEGCWFHRVCRAPQKMGAIYARLGNHPHMRGTVIRGNLFQNIGRRDQEPGAAICLADGTMGVRISDNVFHRVGSGKASRTILIDGGAHVTVENNTFIDCPVPFGLQFTPLVTGSSERMDAWRNLLTSDSTRKHRVRYRALAEFFKEDREFPDTNSFSGNRIANGRMELLAGNGYIVSGGPEEKLNTSGNVIEGALRGISFDSGGRPIIPGRRPWRPMTASNH